MGVWRERQARLAAQQAERQVEAARWRRAERLVVRVSLLTHPAPPQLNQLIALGLCPRLRPRPRDLKLLDAAPSGGAQPVQVPKLSDNRPCPPPLKPEDLASYGPPRYTYIAAPVTLEQLATYGPPRARYISQPATSLASQTNSVGQVRKKTLFPGSQPQGEASAAPRPRRPRRRVKVWSFPHV